MKRIGILGLGRGLEFFKNAKTCKVVAICENNLDLIARVEKDFDFKQVELFTDFDEFIKYDMDAVVLSNFATEHAPFAIKALKAGKHVLSEVLPVKNLSEAVELIETIESTGKIYAYSENYCFFKSIMTMKQIYDSGALGQIEYAEGEYIHNCEPIWPYITYGEKDHWRNNIQATFYCTHSIGPIIHVTKLHPVKVVGFELPFNDRTARMGLKSGVAGIEMITLENGAVIKSVHGCLAKDSIWYCLYGEKGRVETSREDAQITINNREIMYKNLNKFETSYEGSSEEILLVSNRGNQELHGGSDYIVLDNFIKYLEDGSGDIIDIYEALDMSLPGLMAYKSILSGGIPMEIPDFRDKEVREKYRNDTMCCDKKAAGEMYVPSYSKGEIEIPDEVYKIIKDKYLESFKKEDKNEN